MIECYPEIILRINSKNAIVPILLFNIGVSIIVLLEEPISNIQRLSLTLYDPFDFIRALIPHFK